MSGTAVLGFSLRVLGGRHETVRFVTILLFVIKLLYVDFPFISNSVLDAMINTLLVYSNVTLVIKLFDGHDRGF